MWINSKNLDVVEKLFLLGLYTAYDKNRGKFTIMPSVLHFLQKCIYFGSFHYSPLTLYFSFSLVPLLVKL